MLRKLQIITLDCNWKLWWSTASRSKGKR